MIISRSLIAVAVLWLSWSAPGAAQDLLNPSVSFEADRVVRANGQEWRGTVRHRPGQTREEAVVDGRRRTLFLDARSGVAILAGEDMPMAVQLPLDLARDMLSELPNQIESLDAEAQENVAGVPATRYRVVDGGREGRLWLSDDGVVLRLEGRDERGRTVSMRLENYREAPQEDRWFVPPPPGRRLVLNIGRADGAELRRMLEGLGALR